MLSKSAEHMAQEEQTKTTDCKNNTGVLVMEMKVGITDANVPQLRKKGRVDYHWV